MSYFLPSQFLYPEHTREARNRYGNMQIWFPYTRLRFAIAYPTPGCILDVEASAGTYAAKTQGGMSAMQDAFPQARQTTHYHTYMAALPRFAAKYSRAYLARRTPYRVGGESGLELSTDNPSAQQTMNSVHKLP